VAAAQRRFYREFIGGRDASSVDSSSSSRATVQAP
jgi:hypothetical protein